MRDAARDIALPSGLPLSQVLPSDCTRPTEQVQLDFRFVTYNVLSLFFASPSASLLLPN